MTPNVESGPRRFCGAALRFAALLAPQMIVSAIALWGFTRAFYLRTDFGWLHLPLVAVVQCAFYAAWAALAGSRLGEARVTPYLFAASLWAKALAINGIYIASAATNTFWAENFAMENVVSARVHLVGLHAAFGRIVPLCVAGAVLAMAGTAAVFLKCAPSLYRLLRRGTQGPVPQPRPVGPAIATVCGATAALAVLGCWMQIDLRTELRRDPLFSFWLQIERPRDPAGALADTQARQAYPVVPAFDRKNVFIFNVDSLRSDHLPMYGYPRDTTPFLQELQRAGRLAVVRRGVSVGNSSRQGMFGILMSRYSEKQQPGAFMLPEVLKLEGYRVAAFMAGDESTFSGVRRFYGRSFDQFVDGPAFRTHSVNDDAGILEALNTLPPSDGTPVFLLFHLMSVHVLGVRQPAFARWSPSHFDARYANASYVFEPEFAKNTYDNRILQMDDYLRRIWSVLEAKGYLKNYAAVVAGDHGEGLGERGNYGHGRGLFHEDTSVPILFAGSERPPVEAALGSQIDIAPTVLSMLGLPVPSVWDGIPLTSASGRNTAFLSSRRAGGWRGVVKQDEDGAFKYLFFGPINGEWREALFDLRSDPEEGHDLIRNPPRTTLNALRQLAAAHFRVPIPPDVLRTGERTSPDFHHDATGE